mmetsp:Transcript_12792/g.31408  ORF Transcript_12792/g.31408 Transcript_12792/m.31408 type:complete len:220 (+) Transcript_12792:560-1219(+)
MDEYESMLVEDYLEIRSTHKNQKRSAFQKHGRGSSTGADKAPHRVRFESDPLIIKSKNAPPSNPIPNEAKENRTPKWIKGPGRRGSSRRSISTSRKQSERKFFTRKAQVCPPKHVKLAEEQLNKSIVHGSTSLYVEPFGKVQNFNRNLKNQSKWIHSRTPKRRPINYISVFLRHLMDGSKAGKKYSPPLKVKVEDTDNFRVSTLGHRKSKSKTHIIPRL